MDAVRTALDPLAATAFWREVADGMPQLAWINDPSGKPLWFNRSWQAYTGASSDELMDSWSQFHHPDHKRAVIGSFAECLDRGESWQGRYPLRGRDGYRWFLGHAQPLRDAEGRITHWFGTNTDITDQVRADEEAKEAGKRLNAILDNTTMGVFLMNENQHCVFANAAAETLTGYSFAQMQGRPLHDVVHHKRPDGSHYPLDECPIDRAFPERAQMQGEELFVAPDGSFYPVAFTASPLLDDGGQPVGTVIEARNIAARREREAALLASQQRYRAVFDQARVGVARVAPDGTFLEINDRYCEILRRSREEILGGGWKEITHPDDLPEDLRRVEAMLRGELGSYSLEKRYVAKDGSPIWVNLSVAAERSPDGKVKFFIPVVEDINERKAAEQALRESEALTRRISDVAPCILYIYDLENQKNVWGNREMFEVLGYSREQLDEFGGQLIANLMHPDDAARYVEHQARIAALGEHETANYRYRFRRADGGWVWLDSYDMVFRRNEVGIPTQIIGAALDVTEQQEAVESLRLSEERYRALFTSMEQGFCTIQVMMEDEAPVDYRFTELNPAFTAHTGLSQDVLHRWVREAVPDLEQSWFERYGQVARTGQSARFTDYAEALGRWFDVYAFRIGDPTENSVAILFSDITAERENRVALERSEARLRAVIDAAPVGLVFADASGQITGGNSRVEEIIGQRVVQSEAVEQYKADYVAFHPDGRQVESDEYPLARVLRGEGERAELVCHVQRGDGSRVWVRYVATPVLDIDGTLTGGVVASIDIDREKLLSEGLEREVERVIAEREAAQEALRQSQKLEAMGQLTGGVAHDFNNLLTPIIGSLDLLHRKKVGDDRTQRLVDGALQSAERAKTLVQRLLAFARRQPLKPTAVDVGRIVSDMAELIGSTSGPRIRVEHAVQDQLPAAHADGNQLEMALLNLSVNARDAMPDGGTLRIAVARRDDTPADVPASPGASHIVLTVSDTGSGMDEETRRRAIEPFFSTKGVGKGTGLGLSMVHGLAAQLGGALRIASEVGKGTSIELWLPLSEAAVEDAARPTGATTARGRGTVLLVDDEELVRSSTASMLADLGFEVEEAASAEEALAKVAGGLRPDVLISDQLMPGLSGTDLAVNLRRKLPMLPVLIVSGYAGAESLSPGFPHLSKPFRHSDLAASVAALTGEMGGAAQD